MYFVLLALYLLIEHAHSSESHWGYHNTSDWSDSYTECGFNQQMQSPIDIIIDSETTCDPIELDLDWNLQNSHFAIRNNGHSLQAIPFEIEHKGGSDFSELEVLHHANDTNIRLKNLFYNTFKSSVNAEYCFDSLHFHWDKTNNFGSEHAINGNKYPLELHIVFYSCDYYVFGDALKSYTNNNNTEIDDNNVLSVIGILFEIGESNPVLDIILETNIVNNIYKYDSNTFNNLLQLYYTQFDIFDLLPSNKEVISYLGSLTTPPCYETVRWNVMKNTMSVSEHQMEKFRLMLQTSDNETIAPNWRPLQNINNNNRILYQCKKDIELLNVKKEDMNKIINDNNNNNNNNDNDKWFVIGIIFICLFVISMTGNGYFLISKYYIEASIDDNNKSISLIETNNNNNNNNTDTKNEDRTNTVNEYHKNEEQPSSN